MQYLLTKQFEKEFARLPKKMKQKAITAIELFLQNQHDEKLHNHKLSGKYKTYSSINITGDIRSIYVMADKETVQFVALGTHSELYGT